MTRRYVTGCAAVHPDRRGGQHVGSCSGVLIIDEDAGLGVLVTDERSQIKNKVRAEALIDAITAHAALVEACMAWQRATDEAWTAEERMFSGLPVLEQAEARQAMIDHLDRAKAALVAMEIAVRAATPVGDGLRRKPMRPGATSDR